MTQICNPPLHVAFCTSNWDIGRDCLAMAVQITRNILSCILEVCHCRLSSCVSIVFQVGAVINLILQKWWLVNSFIWFVSTLSKVKIYLANQWLCHADFSKNRRIVSLCGFANLSQVYVCLCTTYSYNHRLMSQKIVLNNGST